MPSIAWQFALDSDGEVSEAAGDTPLAAMVAAAGDTLETATAELQAAEPSAVVLRAERQRCVQQLKAAKMREAKARKRIRAAEGEQMNMVDDVVLSIRSHSALRLRGVRHAVVSFADRKNPPAKKRRPKLLRGIRQAHVRIHKTETGARRAENRLQSVSKRKRSSRQKVPNRLALAIAYDSILRQGDVAQSFKTSGRVVVRLRRCAALAYHEYQLGLAETLLTTLANSGGRLQLDYL